jgi:uncharacterized protein YecE (DUF72 family)
MEDKEQIFVGTSGWSYGHWKGHFYPEKTAATAFLAHYAGQLKTVEINNTFYGLPSESSIRKWRQTTPEGFLFAVKANRVITHDKRMVDTKADMQAFLNRVELLGSRLGPVLIQLPPKFPSDPARLQTFLLELPSGYRYAIEFRDPDWFNEHVYGLLREMNIAFCIYDYNRRVTPKMVTADFIYTRLHGAQRAYYGSYSDAVLDIWAGFFNGCIQQGKDVFCYFDNTASNDAPFDAQRLWARLQ